MRLLRAAADLLAPRECVVCGRRLGLQEDEICIFCEADLPLTRYSSRVHNPMADRINLLIERHRSDSDQEAYAYAASLILYHSGNPYSRIPQALKYRYRLSTGRYFARRLGAEMASAGHFGDVDLVVPVPLHWTRRFQRGYNQSEVIAREVARALGVPCRDILRRNRRTGTQTRLSVEGKERNVRGAFSLKAGVLRDGNGSGLVARHLLLVDDTFTTGATLYECFAALRSALGPSVRISFCTLASVTGM